MSDQPVIIGAACRLPGATNLDELWHLLRSGRDVQRRVPLDRFNVDAFHHPNHTNKSTTNTRHGYFLDQGLDKFDAAFFNISGKEAEAMDPQQRILLEVVYEAFENAGLTIDQLRGSSTAVFAAAFTYDYQTLTHRDLAHHPVYAATGATANGVLANRVSHAFRLRGPSVHVDTACSSSLTALHLAVRSLLAGDCDRAIVCASALHFDPAVFVTMAHLGVLSADARCRHLDAAASGYARGEGVCAVVLERRRDAERVAAGRRIRAVVRATGVNHDGDKDGSDDEDGREHDESGGRGGMTLPSSAAQARLVRSVYRAAGLDPRDTDYVEAHGTGTQAGDVREASSIGRVFGRNRCRRPLYVGSVKTNIGHLEGAAGLAGLLKALLCLENATILPNMHFDTPNPAIDFDALGIRVAREPVSWEPGADGVRRASVNAFGFGGANAHAVLENYVPLPDTEQQPQMDMDNPVSCTNDSNSDIDVTKRPFLLPLTSHSEQGGKLLQHAVSQYMDQNPDTKAADLAYTYSSWRSMHQFRAFAVGSDLDTLREATVTLSPLAGWRQTQTSRPPSRLGFIFTGQGAQWYAMGRELIEQSAPFRNALTACDSVLQTLPDRPAWSIIDEMTRTEAESRIARSEFSQPLCTALQIALVDTLSGWGVTPSAVVGHSSGEMAAAYAAGILSRRDAIICAYYRGLYMSKGCSDEQQQKSAPATGAMMAVGLTEAEAKLTLAPYAGRVCVAAVNSPSSVTLSGDADAISELKKSLEQDSNSGSGSKVFARLLQVEQAFHSHHMLPLAPAFQKALAAPEINFRPQSASVPMFSSVTARDSTARAMDARYWTDNMTGSVRFSDAVVGMLLDDNDNLAVDALIEIGPHPALRGPTKQTIKALDMGLDLPYIASLDRKATGGAYESLLACAGQLFSLGYPVDLVAVNCEFPSSLDGSPSNAASTDAIPGQKPRRLYDIPTYSWNHEKSYWAETRWNREYRQRPHRHSLLGAPVPGSPSNNPRWRSHVRVSELPWIRDHVVHGRIILPAAAFFSLALEAFVRTTDVTKNAAHDIVLSDVCVSSVVLHVPPDSEIGVEIMVDLLLLSDEPKTYRFTVYSFTEHGETVLNCSGSISQQQRQAMTASSKRVSPAQMDRRVSADKFYRRLHAKTGMQYGETFQLVQGAVQSSTAEGSAEAKVHFDPATVATIISDGEDADPDRYVLHPCLLDATFHVLLAALEATRSDRGMADAHVVTSCKSLRVSPAMMMMNHDKHCARTYWVRARRGTCNYSLSGKSNSIDMHGLDSDEFLIQARGLELTPLPRLDHNSEYPDPAATTTAPPFFRIKWQPAFDALGRTSSEASAELASLDELLRCYRHQYPAGRVIDIDESANLATQATEKAFDLAIVRVTSLQQAVSYIKPLGYVICHAKTASAAAVPQSLTLKFHNNGLQIWQQADLPCSATKKHRNLTLLVSSSPSRQSDSLAKAIRESLPDRHISILSFDKLTEYDVIENDLVSLIGLHDINGFNNVLEQAHKLFFTSLVSSSAAKANIVWLLSGSTHLSSSQLAGASTIRSMARVARSENICLSLKLLQVPAEQQEPRDLEHICSAIEYALAAAQDEEELMVENDGCIQIPRIEPDRTLNARYASGMEQQMLIFKDHPLKFVESALDGAPVAEQDALFEITDGLATPLAADEIEISVQTSALVRGMNSVTCCVGRVMTAGSGALASISGGLAVGDEVFALAPNASAHSSVLRISHQLAYAWDAKAMARVVPIAEPLLQVSYAIYELARIGEGDLSVIYDAATPEGEIALHLLQAAGSSVIAFVRSESDKKYVVDKFRLGADNVRIKGSEVESFCRCRLLLNCSQQDSSAWEGDSIATMASCVFTVDDESNLVFLRSTMEQDAAAIRKLFSRGLGTLYGAGAVFSSRDVKRVPYSQIDKAVKALSADSSLSQVVLYDDKTPVRVRSGNRRDTQVLFDAEKTYLVAGSMGHASWTLTQWLYQKGARKLHLLSTPLCQPLTAEMTAWLEERGVVVTITSVHEYDKDGLEEWVAAVDGTIGGIIHAAIPLESQPTSEATASVGSYITAMLALHKATASVPPDFFLCISSVASTIGIPSELPFSIVNGFMNDLVAWRRHHGLPAASVNVGLVTDLGNVADETSSIALETNSIKDALEAVSISPLSEDQLLFQLEQALLSQYPDGEADGTVDHQILSGLSFSSQDSFWSHRAMFRLLCEESSSINPAPSVTKDLQGQMRDAPNVQEKIELLTTSFVKKMSLTLSIAGSEINVGLPLSSYGMDSVAAVDMRTWFLEELNLNLALFEILGSGTIRTLMKKVVELFDAAHETETTPDRKQKRRAVEIKEPKDKVVSELELPRIRPKSIPLSSFQNRQWLVNATTEKDGRLTCGWTLTIQGEPKLELANAVFHEVARRNDIFRTQYVEGPDMVEQQVIDAVPANVEYLDLSSSPDAHAQVEHQVRELIGRPMDLEQGEVYRSRLVKLADSQYAWIFATHHITVDGASRNSFMEQIVACYEDARNGRSGNSTTKPAPKLSYVDFTLWHQQYLQSDRLQADLAWWKQHLANSCPASKLLPFSQRETRGPRASQDRRVIRSAISAATLKRMKRICSGVGVTPFHFVAAALRTLVFRYTGEEDFTLLVINGERPHPAFEGVIGFFVNIIPLLWRGSFDGTFASLLDEAKTLAVEAMEHSQAPFDAIVDKLGLGRNQSHFPLGQIALNYQLYAKSPRYTTGDFQVRDVHVTDVPTAFEIQLEALEDPGSGGLALTLDYDSYLYGDPEMDRFLENLVTLVGSAVRDFRQPIEEMDMCGPLEISFLRDTCWREQESTQDWMGQSLAPRWADVVAQQPHALAIKTSDGAFITFAELDTRARKMAGLLQSLGVSSGDRVGVLSDPCIDVVAAMIALALLGCAYVALDPTAAPGRLEYMIQSSSASLVLHGGGHDGDGGGADLEKLVEDLACSTMAKFVRLSCKIPPFCELSLPSNFTAKPDDICYIVFTSGSTGKPKGVQVTFENTESMLCGRQQMHNLGSADVFLQQSSNSFDISMAQVWGPLTSGATMALATREVRQHADQLAEFILSSGASMIYMTPTHLAMLLENCSDVMKQCRRLRAVSLVGEHLPPRLVAAVYDLGLPQVAVFNEYGPSESTSQSTLYKVPYPTPRQTSIDIGFPIPNNSVYVLNSRGRPVPAGVYGELCIGGAQVSRGYLGHASSSAAFLDNEFLSCGIFKERGWNRLYRTGDIARFRLNGSIDLQGRIAGDKQIKLRGHRIDLGEIEAEILRIVSENKDLLGTVKNAILLARTQGQAIAPVGDDMTDDRQLAAFLSTKKAIDRTEAQAMATKLHHELAKTLNQYMLPACYQPMTVIPTTVSGKIDRVKLSTMALDPIFHTRTTAKCPSSLQDEKADEAKSASGTPPELERPSLETLKSLFARILKLPTEKRILDTDNFFELGGQSVLALRLQKALRAELGVQVKLVDIFRYPTPGELGKKFGFEQTAVVDNSHDSSPTVAKIDWDTEIALPVDARYIPGGFMKETTEPALPQKDVLIAGADGYIGYYLLKYLLLILPADVKIFLVGIGGTRFNLGDLVAALTSHQLLDEETPLGNVLTRVQVLPGSLGEERYGLSAADFAQLGERVAHIYHTGGFVSLLASYSELRARNFASVLTMMELASHGRDTVVHYISTWSVVHMQAWTSTRATATKPIWRDEQSVASFRPPATDDHGYFKTRWAAEMVLEEAARRGFRVTIYRCPAHTAPPRSSACVTPADNFTINMNVRMANTGLVLREDSSPSMESCLGMVPIDYLADTLVRLRHSKSPRDSEALRLHITNPRSLAYSALPSLVAKLREDGQPGTMLPLDAWFEAMTGAGGPEHIILELAMYKEYLDMGHVMFALDDMQTRSYLEEIQGQQGRVRCDAVDLGYLQNLIKQEKNRKGCE